MFTAEVRISLKKGVADPEGANTMKALNLLGFNVKDVRTVKLFEIDFECESEEKARKEVEEMCKKLLANPVIHKASIEIR